MRDEGGRFATGDAAETDRLRLRRPENVFVHDQRCRRRRQPRLCVVYRNVIYSFNKVKVR